MSIQTGEHSRILYDQQERMLGWAASALQKSYPTPNLRFRPDAQAIGHERGGELVGVIVFDTWSDGDCLIHVVSDGSRRWFTRAFCRCAMAFPFHQVGTRRITAIVSERNPASLGLCDHFGFKVEGRLRKGGPLGEDLILLGLLREECRWIDGRKPAIVRLAAA